MNSNPVHRWPVLLTCSLTTGLCLLLLWSLQLFAQSAASRAAPDTTIVSSSDQQTTVDPLPGGCIGNTPPGADAPVCCISGFVFLNGQKISNAQVTIVDQVGTLTQAPTEVYDSTNGPYYRINLAGLTRPITPTDVITIYATYGSLSSAPVRHTVQRDGQQVNLLLYDPNPNALALAGQTQGQGEPGKFKFPYDVATDRWGNVYSLDFNQRVQVFDPQGNLLARPNWDKGYGDLPNQLAAPSGIAIDQRLDRVYIADGRNRRVGVYTTDGDLLALWDGTNTDDQQSFGYPEDVAVDAQSNVYVLAQQSPHAIYKFDAAGNFLTRWGIYGSSAGEFVYPRQIAVTAAGEVLVTENTQTVYKFDAVGTLLPFTVTFPAELASSPVISVPLGIATGHDGSIYLYDHYVSGGESTGRVLQLNAQGVVTRAWNYPTREPDTVIGGYGMTVNGDTLFLAGYEHHKLFRLNLAGGLREPWGDIARNAGQLFQPHGVALAPAASPWAGSLFVTDCTINRISQIVDDAIVQSWDELAADGGTNWCPWNLVFDPQGKLYVVDPSQNLLYRYVVNESQLVLDGGPWSGIINGRDQAAIAIDQNGRIYLTEPSANRVTIFQLTTPMTLTKLATYDGSAEPSGPLNNPKALAVDDSDLNAVLVYVADTDNHRLLTLSYANGALTYQDSWGIPVGATSGICGDKDETTLSSPLGIAVGHNGAIYVADTFANRVVKFDSAGNCVSELGSIDPGPDQMAAPEGLALDANDQLFVVDSSLARILRLNPLAPAKPIATIVHLSSADLVPGEVLTVLGAGQTGNNAQIIDQYEWTTATGLTINSTEPTVAIPTGETPTTADKLGPGAHQLRLRVQSSSGEWSEPATYSVYVAHRQPDASTTPGELPPATGCPAGSLWTFLLYLDADYADQGRLSSAYSEARAALAGVNNSCVQFAIQIDGPASIGQPTVGDSRRWIVRTQPFTEQILTVGEAPMDTANGLAEFIIWGQQTLPADHYYLAIANHGDGARGIAWDHTTATDDSAYLTAAEIRSVLERTDIAPIDILHLDACSMGLLDVAYQLRTKVKVLITSQYLGWGFFAYATYAQTITLAITPAELATNIVNRYAALAEQLGLPYTLAAWDLRRIEPVKNGVDELSVLLKAWVGNDNSNHGRRNQLHDLRYASQFFDSNADYLNSSADNYLDLFDWLARLQNANLNGDITQAAAALISELQRTDSLILLNRVRSGNLPPQYQNGAAVDLSGAHGVSIFYPLEGELRLALPQQSVSAVALAATTTYSYTQLYADYINQRLFDFTLASRWDEFLQAAYGTPANDTPLEPPSPPVAPLDVSRRVYLPLIIR